MPHEADDRANSVVKNGEFHKGTAGILANRTLARHDGGTVHEKEQRPPHRARAHCPQQPRSGRERDARRQSVRAEREVRQARDEERDYVLDAPDVERQAGDASDDAHRGDRETSSEQPRRRDILGRGHVRTLAAQRKDDRGIAQRPRDPNDAEHGGSGGAHAAHEQVGDDQRTEHAPHPLFSMPRSKRLRSRARSRLDGSSSSCA